MRALSPVIRLVAAASLAAATASAAKAPEVPHTTRVAGKAPVNIGGAWLVYAQAQFAGDKSRALQPELWTVARKGDQDVTIRLLDVSLPKSIDESFRAANKQPKAWEPTPADLALLRKDWSKLTPPASRDVHRGDVAYGNVNFTLASPDKYGEVFPAGDTGIGEALKGSLFALQAVERFSPLPVPSGENVAQVMERNTIYVVQKTSDSLIEGKQFTGYVAAGPGAPIPITLVGPFRFYRLAKGSVGTAAAPSTPRSKPKAHK